MEDNWYSKLAKAGYLGTKAQVSADYGHPEWESTPQQPEDAHMKALKKVMNKHVSTQEPEGTGS